MTWDWEKQVTSLIAEVDQLKAELAECMEDQCKDAEELGRLRREIIRLRREIISKLGKSALQSIQRESAGAECDFQFQDQHE